MRMTGELEGWRFSFHLQVKKRENIRKPQADGVEEAEGESWYWQQSTQTYKKLKQQEEASVILLPFCNIFDPAGGSALQNPLLSTLSAAVNGPI